MKNRSRPRKGRERGKEPEKQRAADEAATNPGCGAGEPQGGGEQKEKVTDGADMCWWLFLPLIIFQPVLGTSQMTAPLPYF